jgi:hypothetical protein
MSLGESEKKATSLPDIKNEMIKSTNRKKINNVLAPVEIKK